MSLSPVGALMFLGNGNVTRQPLTDILRNVPAETDDTVEADRLDSAVTCMRSVKHKHNEAFLVAGDEDGSVRVWSDS